MSESSVNGKFRVLAYHSIDNQQNFESQIIYLKQNYNIIGLNELESCLKNFHLIPNNSILITFDDGDLSLYVNALPILKKYNIPSISFIITDLINTNKPFWWDEIEYYLGKVKGNEKVWEIKEWPNFDREKYLEDLRRNHEKPFLKSKQLNTSQLIEMQHGGMDIANHSHTHPMFNNCTIEELEFEIQQSKGILNSLHFNENIFAYPNGNFSEKSEAILNKYGVQLSFLFDHKINRGAINPLRISRLRVNDTTPLWKLKFILSGWHSKFLPLIKATAKLINR